MHSEPPGGLEKRTPALIGWQGRQSSQWERFLLSGALPAGVGGLGAQAVTLETLGENLYDTFGGGSQVGALGVGQKAASQRSSHVRSLECSSSAQVLV